MGVLCAFPMCLWVLLGGDEEMVDLVDLVDAGTHPSGFKGGCWASRLPDDLRGQVVVLRSMVDKGKPPYYEGIAEALTEGGFSVSAVAVSRHLRRKCSCE